MTWKSAGKGAKIGASIGSVIPGVGTLLGGLGGGIVGGISSLFGKKKKRAPAPVDNSPTSDMALKAQMAQALQGRAPGQNTMADATARTAAFDPQASAAASAKGSYDLMKPQLDRDIDSFRQGQVGLGRLRSGFAGEGEDSIMRDAFSNLNARVAQNSLTTAGMMQQNNRDLGAAGQMTYGNHMDAITGQMDRNTGVQNAANQSADARSNSRTQAIGQVGGAIAAKVPWGKVASWAGGLFK